MALSPELSRLAKMLIDAEGITDDEAEARLRSMTLEIIVGRGAHNQAGHNAILTAVAVGGKSFVGGVGVRLLEDVELISSVPIGTSSLREAIAFLGATELGALPSARIAIGEVDAGIPIDAHAWWDGWKGGSRSQPIGQGGGDNPLAGIVAGAAAVARAFAKLRGVAYPSASEFDLWPLGTTEEPPAFRSVYFPGSLWLLGLGNLGQAVMWSLSALPYRTPGEVKLVLQDADRISAENWGPSVLVRSGQYGEYKTALSEVWGKRKGFDVRRVDRWLDERQRIQDGEPALAVCGFDSIEARKHFDTCGFDVVVDAGLGRTHTDFDVFRVTIFDSNYSAAAHFPNQTVVPAPSPHDYEELLGLDQCGAALFEGIGVAVPFVSSIAAATVVARTIAISSGVPVSRNEKRRLSSDTSRLASRITASARGIIRLSQ
jgi:hypothetical protein